MYHAHEIDRKLQLKADAHETHTLRSDVARLERTVRELGTENDGLRRRVEMLEESCRAYLDQWQQDNSQFGVGA